MTCRGRIDFTFCLSMVPWGKYKGFRLIRNLSDRGAHYTCSANKEEHESTSRDLARGQPLFKDSEMEIRVPKSWRGPAFPSVGCCFSSYFPCFEWCIKVELKSQVEGKIQNVFSAIICLRCLMHCPDLEQREGLGSSHSAVVFSHHARSGACAVNARDTVTVR